MTLPSLTPLAVTINEACRLSGLGISSIYDLMREGRLASTPVGRRRLVNYASLEALLAQKAANTIEPMAAPPKRRGRPRKVAAVIGGAA
jgi:excisionase family DNA binding protein